VSLPDRIASKIGSPDERGCWPWLAARNKGYGVIRIGGRSDGHLRAAHRVVYETLIGPVPESLQLDHLCRNRGCVNPEHLEPVTQEENIRRGTGASAQNARKTHCVNGHEFTPENTYVHRRRGRPDARECRTCHNTRRRSA